MSQPTPRIVRQNEPPKRRWWLFLGGGTLWISILVHVVFVAGAAYIVVQHFSKKHVNFVATAPPQPHNEVEHKIQVAKKNSVESAPPDLKRITTTDVSAITVPDVPEPPKIDDATPTTMSGAGDMGSGMGSGNGTGGSGSGGGVPVFGSADGKGLEGYFYDLKQSKERKPTGMTLSKFYSEVKEYMSHNWEQSELDRFYKSPKPLYTTRIVIPLRPSRDAPAAFHMDVEPSLWAIHYHGKVSAPEGDYHFVGFGDNILIVRINGITVFDGGYTTLVTGGAAHHLPFLWAPEYSRRNKDRIPNSELKQGLDFHMDGAQPVDMDVLIGDDGGTTGFFLMVMKVGSDYHKLNDGTPEAPFFQLDNHEAPKLTGVTPPHSDTTEPWQQGDSDAP